MAVLVAGFGAFAVANAPPAAAYDSKVAEAIAARAPGALPAAARWPEVSSPDAAGHVGELLDLEASDPEAHLHAHRFVAGAPLAADDDEAGRVTGTAPWRLRDAVLELEAAMRARDAAAVSRAIARLSIATADLADPFLVTAPAPFEAPGAHAWFSYDVPAAELKALLPREITAPDALTAALELATRAASRRAAIEAAALQGDAVRLHALRRDCMGEALAVVNAFTVRAWEASGALGLDGPRLETGALRVWPNPARGEVTLALTTAGAGPGRIEVLDVAGRRRWSGDIAFATPGAQQVRIPAAVVRALSPGLYVARVSAGATQVLGRWVRVRD